MDRAPGSDASSVPLRGIFLEFDMCNSFGGFGFGQSLEDVPNLSPDDVSDEPFPKKFAHTGTLPGSGRQGCNRVLRPARAGAVDRRKASLREGQGHFASRVRIVKGGQPWQTR